MTRMALKYTFTCNFTCLPSLPQWLGLKGEGRDALKSTTSWKLLTRMIFIISLSEPTSLSK